MSKGYMAYLGIDSEWSAYSTRGLYGLVDPRVGSVHYIGRAQDFRQRYVSHVGAARTLAATSSRWIRSLWQEGVDPVMVDLGPDTENEYQFMKAMLDLGCGLVNGPRDIQYALTSPKRTSKARAAAIADRAERHVRSLERTEIRGWLMVPEAHVKRIDAYHAEMDARRRAITATWERTNAERRAYILGDGLVNEIRGRAAQ